MKSEEFPKLSKSGKSWKYPEAKKGDRPLGACVKQPKIKKELGLE